MEKSQEDKKQALPEGLEETEGALKPFPNEEEIRREPITVMIRLKKGYYTYSPEDLILLRNIFKEIASNRQSDPYNFGIPGGSAENWRFWLILLDREIGKAVKKLWEKDPKKIELHKGITINERGDQVKLQPNGSFTTTRFIERLNDDGYDESYVDIQENIPYERLNDEARTFISQELIDKWREDNIEIVMLEVRKAVQKGRENANFQNLMEAHEAHSTILLDRLKSLHNNAEVNSLEELKSFYDKFLSDLYNWAASKALAEDLPIDISIYFRESTNDTCTVVDVYTQLADLRDKISSLRNSYSGIEEKRINESLNRLLSELIEKLEQQRRLIEDNCCTTFPIFNKGEIVLGEILGEGDNDPNGNNFDVPGRYVDLRITVKNKTFIITLFQPEGEQEIDVGRIARKDDGNLCKIFSEDISNLKDWIKTMKIL